MSAGPYDQTSPATTPGTQEASTTDVAKEEAASVAADAKEGTQQVAETAKGEAQAVAAEAQQTAKDLYHQLMSELTGQGSQQQSRAAQGLQTLADDLGQMAGSAQSGVAGDIARQVSEQARSAAQWLEGREPGDVVDEVRRFARRRPGAFLAGAALVGLAAGRLTRGVVAEKQDESSGTPAGVQGSPRPVGAVSPPPPSYPVAGTAAAPVAPAVGEVPPVADVHEQPFAAPATDVPSARPLPGDEVR